MRRPLSTTKTEVEDRNIREFPERVWCDDFCENTSGDRRNNESGALTVK